MISLIDCDDLHFAMGRKWYADRKGNTTYVSARINGKIKRLHCHIMGDAAPGMMVDHINGNGLDNRRANLRWATKKQNAHNSANRKRKGTSKFKGVDWDKRRNKWRAQICTDLKNKFLGYFSTEHAAAIAYDLAAMAHYGEYAHVNFPQGESTCAQS